MSTIFFNILRSVKNLEKYLRKTAWLSTVLTEKFIFYCGKDLPGFLEERRKAGLLTITDANQRAEKTALDVLASDGSKKKSSKKLDK